jgi:hypothetical protein
MDKRLLIVLLGLLFGSAVFAQAYRWVDEDGVVHFSDRPQPGAQEFDLPEANVTSVRPVDRSNSSRRRATDEEEDFTYEVLEITTPAAEETLWNIEGVLNVTLRTRPALRPGDQVRVYFDGQSRIVDGLSFDVNNVYRGVHNIQAEIVDPGGALLIRSQPNRFYVQQTSILN